MIFQTINKKLLELGPSLGFLFKKTCTFSFVYIGKNGLYRKKNKTLLIGKKGQFIWSLFLPLSALCALSSTPLSFCKRNGPTIEILLIIEETSLKRKS